MQAQAQARARNDLNSFLAKRFRAVKDAKQAALAEKSSAQAQLAALQMKHSQSISVLEDERDAALASAKASPAMLAVHTSSEPSSGLAALHNLLTRSSIAVSQDACGSLKRVWHAVALNTIFHIGDQQNG
jgi:hypothetical protein